MLRLSQGGVGSGMKDPKRSKAGLREQRREQKAREGIPKRLAEIRGERSQREFARQLDVFQQNINRYELGTMPHADFLIRLHQREGVSIDWLLTGTGERYVKRGPRRP